MGTSNDLKTSQEDRVSTLSGTELVRVALMGGGNAAVTTQQIADLADAPPTFSGVVTDSTTSHTLTGSDEEKYTRLTNAGAKTLTIDSHSTHAITLGSECHFRNVGAGACTINPNSAVTVHVPAGGSLVVPQGGTVTLKNVAVDEFDLIGLTS
jgi:hypothetical protein